ncbi:MAG TPA: A/G-specific adenine glycosylase [Planctomycetota bacterium]|nr:A/G-specific adenine glycosylase [Planctomycetota bacterium]
MTESAGRFAGRLLTWFDANRRDLPWRRTGEPWAIWVSEVMLQQTRVEAVRSAFEQFMRRFPTPADFAAASDDDLFVAWRGLGYYRRARLLRDGARAVVETHGGVVPDAPAALAALPGIGPYTLGALASIAFGRPEVAVDGNVERVAARYLGSRVPTHTAAGRKRIRTAVSGWLDRRRPGDFNQALMELGAMVCTPTAPDCANCPIATGCVARERGLVDELPVRKKPQPAVQVTARVALAVGPEGALGGRIAAGEANGGQIELPGAGMLTDVAVDDLRPALLERFGAHVRVGGVVASVRHAITCHRIVLHAHAAEVREPGRLAWFPIDDRTPWTTPSRKVFRAALHTGGELRV